MEPNTQPSHFKILMAEQDPFLSQMYQQKFEQCGFNFVHVPDIKEGFVELVAKEKPHIISLGVVFPTIDGFMAIQLLKKDERTKDIPVIFLTNMGMKKDIETGLSLGAIDYLVMAHITPIELVNTVIRHINKVYNANIASIEVQKKIEKKEVEDGSKEKTKESLWQRIFKFNTKK